jgi:SAM-dependent methyltransferase
MAGQALVTGPEPRPDPGSFRDPDNQVYYAGGEVRRGLRGAAVADWRALAATGFFGRLVRAGTICRTEPVDPGDPGFEVTLRHQPIPFISYPYEWTFSMLRDAALLHLEVLAEALSEQISTKDGSAYNLQWRGATPTFIDIGSFERLREGEPWAGYRQFCQTLLYPLLLTAHTGVDFQPWLRAQIDGIEAGQLRRLLRGRAAWRAGVLKHVRLPDALQRRTAGTSSRQMAGELKSAGFSTELIRATIRGLQRLIGKLEWQPPASHWESYRQTCGYSAADRAAKLAFVDRALAGRERELVLDLGANDGAYAQVAARHARQVVAVEGDHPVTDALYRRLRAEGERRVLPLVMDLADPSPGGGWRSVERAPFLGRHPADAVLALALVHHLAIGRNVPLPQLVDLLAALGRELVVEFVEPADPMAQRLLASKPAGLFGDYHREAFERELARRFMIARREPLPSGTRILYAAVPRG